MRGEKEERCLRIVRNSVFCKDDYPMENPFTHKTYLNISNDEFKKNRCWYINTECHRSYFGLLEEDREQFESALRMAKGNPNASCFPDFIFDKGFIEHFQVTSSMENRKGATHTRKENEFYRKVDSERREIETKWNDLPSFDQVRSESWVFTNPIHSYDFLCDSYKRNLERHMESYRKYAGEKEIGIFMIEYPEIALAMHENVYSDWLNGMSSGDMREQEEFKEYRLSRDKKMLEYIYQFKDEIQYVIFLNCKRFEVICIKNIPYLIKLLPWEYVIYPLCVTTLASTHNISISDEKKN